MLRIRKADPTFVNWTPVDAADAVDKFQRLQRNGLPASQIPEALIDCAKGLKGEDVDLFTEWIINPCDAQGADARVFTEQNAADHAKILEEHNRKLLGAVEEEKEAVDQDDEKCAFSLPPMVRQSTCIACPASPEASETPGGVGSIE